MLARDKHSSLLGNLVSYKENEVSWIMFQASNLVCYPQMKHTSLFHLLEYIYYTKVRVTQKKDL
jgi:hypothetical protein